MTSSSTGHSFFIYPAGHGMSRVFRHLGRLQTLQPHTWADISLHGCFFCPLHPTAPIPGLKTNVYRKLSRYFTAKTNLVGKKERMKKRNKSKSFFEFLHDQLCDFL